MHHFAYRDGTLACEDVALSAIAAAHGTPAYVYSTATLTRHFEVFKQAVGDGFVAFAVKANSNLAVLATLGRLGAGADTVSAGEIVRARRAGIAPDRIIFSGVGKTEEELEFAVRLGVRQINVESAAELDLLSSVAARLQAAPAIAVRVNPGIGAGAHDKISTGKSSDKFGVSPADALALYARASANPHLRPVGLAVHIGSQIRDLAPLEAAFTLLRRLAETLRAQGLPVAHLDLGGGLGAAYFDEPDPPTPAAYGAMVKRVFAGMDIGLAYEPGRLIAGNAGVLLARVIRIQERADRRILIVDAAMNDLIRPALYESYHDIMPVDAPAADAPRAPFDVAGPICETGDTFTRARSLTPLAPGALVAFLTAGAYGAVMASTYNSRPLIPEILVNGERFACVRERFGVEAQLQLEPMPSWLAP